MIRKRRGWRPPWRQPPRPTGRRCPSPSIGWQSQAIRWSWTSPWRHPHHHPSPRRGCWRQISKCTQHVSKRYRLGSSTSCWRIPKLPRTNGPSLPSLSPQFVPWTTFAKQIWTPRRLSWIRWCSSHAPVVREERRRRRLVGKKKFLSNNELFFVFQPQRTNESIKNRMTQKISFVSPSFGWFLRELSLFSWLRRAKSSARESFGNEYVSNPSEGRNTYLVDELQTTNVFGSLIRELDGVHRQRRGRLQRDDRRGDEGDALFFFNFLRKQRTKGSKKERSRREWWWLKEKNSVSENAHDGC